MRIISKKRLQEFWESRTHDAKIAEKCLLAWYKIAKNVESWPNFASLKQTFGSAVAVGNCVVFDIGNNRYRLIGRVIYRSNKIYVLKVMDHEEYDRVDWANDCGCYQPPPQKRKRG